MSHQVNITLLTPQQIAWAASHDWFLADNKDGTITVKEVSAANGVASLDLVIWAAGFQALKDWAGY